MKKSVLVLTTVFFMTSAAFAEQEVSLPQSEQEVEDHKTEHEHVFTPEQEEEHRIHIERGFTATEADGYKFKQTDWDECSFNPSGNYSGIQCARSRQISEILKSYLAERVYSCVDAGLRAQGGGSAADIHIVHDGILGDRNHSPKSLHAEARAIDIKSFEVRLAGGATRQIVYEGKTNRAFYRAFRRCWGHTVQRHNGCPLYQGMAVKTGSIGWENADHQHHMHTSVPYCVNGNYGAYYYQR